MRIGKEVKRDTQLMVLSVIILTIVTLNVSYSAFFSVQTLSTIQEISTGNLQVDVQINTIGTVFSGQRELYPSTFEEISNSETGSYASVVLTNTGSVNSDFLISLTYDFDELAKYLEATEGCCYTQKTHEQLLEYMVSLDYLNIAILDTKTNTLVNFSDDPSSEVTTLPLSSLTPSSENEFSYPIHRSMVYVNDGTTQDYEKNYKIYIWLSDETPLSEIGKYAFLKLDVKCAAGEETITNELNEN